MMDWKTLYGKSKSGYLINLVIKFLKCDFGRLGEPENISRKIDDPDHLSQDRLILFVVLLTLGEAELPPLDDRMQAPYEQMNETY
ncbi:MULTISPECIES: hypothetical protein [unclassified Paenibacillus]|uniref:hypothetical protein n=1 Tax=unclassified Paenibacillus TaxID=185978 RepID=UPI0027836FB8|nr:MULTISPECIES: hypothetical protein [unclassified Paenibacillus]MDQ0903477.1 hypothetical protein [Paenibacillus sp. V4I7]MDQ0918045.1 hypothetical protein [Paenibacillus sp. V4I5]